MLPFELKKASDESNFTCIFTKKCPQITFIQTYTSAAEHSSCSPPSQLIRCKLSQLGPEQSSGSEWRFITFCRLTKPLLVLILLILIFFLNCNPIKGEAWPKWSNGKYDTEALTSSPCFVILSVYYTKVAIYYTQLIIIMPHITNVHHNHHHNHFMALFSGPAG